MTIGNSLTPNDAMVMDGNAGHSCQLGAHILYIQRTPKWSQVFRTQASLWCLVGMQAMDINIDSNRDQTQAWSSAASQAPMTPLPWLIAQAI